MSYNDLEVGILQQIYYGHVLSRVKDLDNAVFCDHASSSVGLREGHPDRRSARCLQWDRACVAMLLLGFNRVWVREISRQAVVRIDVVGLWIRLALSKASNDEF